jgi:hypothetical protein
MHLGVRVVRCVALAVGTVVVLPITWIGVAVMTMSGVTSAAWMWMSIDRRAVGAVGAVGVVGGEYSLHADEGR